MIDQCDYTLVSKKLLTYQLHPQVLKLQEAPESIPQGEMPRHLSVYCERVLCERAAPGARVTVLGIYSIKKIIKMGVSYVIGMFTALLQYKINGLQVPIYICLCNTLRNISPHFYQDAFVF